MRKLKVYKKTVSIVKEAALNMFENITGGGRGFLLESYDKNYDRHTIMGDEPDEIISSDKDCLVIKRKDGSMERREGNPAKLLKEYYNEFDIIKDDSAISFNGGLVGSLGYDFVRYSEEIPDDNPDTIGIETVELMLMTRFLVVDHVAETLTAVVLESPDEAGRIKAMDTAKDLIERAMEDAARPVKKDYVRDGKVVDRTDDLASYSEKVEKVRHYIREGHIFQTVLSQRWTVETGQNGFELYKELRELNPSPYLYYFNFGEFEVIGSSPEMVVKQQGNKVYTCPIAGTRKRGRDAAEDERLREELLQDEKEKAEHVMLVDLARNDMGRISEFGTVKVAKFMDVHKYSHVMHIVSEVEGIKKGTYHPFDLVSSFLPAGTLSGAPKIRAMEIIDELEDVRRGLYGGATGYIDFSGDMDLCITIRTMIKQGDKVYIQAGAGLVADSVPAKEYEECCNKAMALAKTVVAD